MSSSKKYVEYPAPFSKHFQKHVSNHMRGHEKKQYFITSHSNKSQYWPRGAPKHAKTADMRRN